MQTLHFFEASRLERDGEVFILGRMNGKDVIFAFGDPQALGSSALGSAGENVTIGQTQMRVIPADYATMLQYERSLVPESRLIPLHGRGFEQSMGMGNRVVVACTERVNDVPILRDPSCLSGFAASYKSTEGTGIPSWFIQQSIARELLPEGVNPDEHPGIGHTGGYGPRELMRAGLFAYGALGGYTRNTTPIGADADHAIIVGRDEASLAESMAHNKLAMAEAKDYTKFTVDTSQLFDYPYSLTSADLRKLLGVFVPGGKVRLFDVPNVLPNREGFRFEFDEAKATSLAQKYWRACQIHTELYEYCVDLKNGEYFDYELSLDETPAPAPADELLFYLVILEEIMGIPKGRVSAAGPNIGYFKRSDYAGDIVTDLFPLANACSSIMAQRGIAFSVHSGDGASPFIGRGAGVDRTVGLATGGKMELKLSDIYQEMLWHALAYSEFPAEYKLFKEIWHKAYQAVGILSRAYEELVVGKTTDESERLLHNPEALAGVGEPLGMRDEAVRLITGVLHYGTGQLKYANHFYSLADVDNRRPTDEFFRRFVQYVFPQVRGSLYSQVTRETWQAWNERSRDYTHKRMRDLGFIR